MSGTGTWPSSPKASATNPPGGGWHEPSTAGAFRRFKNELHDGYPQLLPAWYAFRDARAKRRAVEWLMDNSLIDNDSANHYLAAHRDPDLP